VLELEACRLDLVLFFGEHPIVNSSQCPFSLLVAHSLDLLSVLVSVVTFRCDLVGEVFRCLVHQVLVTTARRQLGTVRLLYVKVISKVLFLGPQNDDHVKDAHYGSHDDALNVDPEYLTTVPGVPQIVDGGCDGWHVDEGDLEESVAIDSLVVFHAVFESSKVAIFAAHAAVVESEQLEGGQHRPVNKLLGCARVKRAVLCKHLVFAIEDALFDKLVEDAVDAEVGHESKRDNDRG
jgi:hypothetical protein